MLRRSLDDETENVVVRVRIPPSRTRREDGLVRRCDRDQLARRPRFHRIVKCFPDELAIAAVVEEPAGVVEQLTHRDPLATRHDSGEPTLDVVRERELPLFDEL